MIKVITGIRRCGKSFLLFNLFRKRLIEKGIHEDHIIQVNLEDRRNKRLRDPDVLLQHIDSMMTDTDKYYILLDEVQLVNEFEDVLNSYLSVPNAEVYVTYQLWQDWKGRKTSSTTCVKFLKPYISKML